MEQGARDGAGTEVSWLGIVGGAIGLLFFSFVMLIVVAVGVLFVFLWWFVTTPVLAVLAATRRWRRPAR